MPLSASPTVSGLTIPSGAKKVTVKEMDANSPAPKEDVTDLASTKKEYAAAPLIESENNTPTKTVNAAGQVKGTFSTTASPTTVKDGWICTQTEEVYEAGKYAQWSANWEYIEPIATGGGGS
jgi:hypothetical protein